MFSGFQNEGLEKSVFAIRFHHSLGDGIAGREFLDKVFDGIPEIPSLPDKVIGTNRFLRNLKMLFWMPVTSSEFRQKAFFHKNYFVKKNSTGEMSLGRITLSLREIKALRNILSDALGEPVPVAISVLLLLGSALTQAIRAGDLKMPSGKIPADFCVALALPPTTPRRPGVFSNCW